MDNLIPVTMVHNGVVHCSPSCRYLCVNPTRSTKAYCRVTGGELDYYDWFIARCQYDSDQYNTVPLSIGEKK